MFGITWQTWLGFAIVLVIVLAGVFVVSAIASLIVRAIARRKDWAAKLIDRARWPFRVFVLVSGIWIAIAIAFPDTSWRPAVDQVMLIALIAVGAWLAAQLFLFLTDLSSKRYRTDVADNQRARRIQTQLQIVRRLVVVVIIVVAIGAILFTFPAVRAVGASVLASAGIISIIAGLAAQSTLANLFAGVQIAFSEAIRVDDVVVVNTEWGRIREITLSYVVVVTWDERTIVLPCTYFTTQPFENWTKYGSALIGTILFDVDWRVSTDAMRAELDRVLAGTKLWDGRTKVLQVVDATGGFVQVRVLVSANDSATLWDLRCLVREQLVEWVRAADPAGLPQHRVLIGDIAEHDVPKTGARKPIHGEGDRAGLFSGTADAEQRAAEFTQAIPVQDIPPEEETTDRPNEDGGEPSTR